MESSTEERWAATARVGTDDGAIDDEGLPPLGHLEVNEFLKFYGKPQIDADPGGSLARAPLEPH